MESYKSNIVRHDIVRHDYSMIGMSVVQRVGVSCGVWVHGLNPRQSKSHLGIIVPLRVSRASQLNTAPRSSLIKHHEVMYMLTVYKYYGVGYNHCSSVSCTVSCERRSVGGVPVLYPMGGTHHKGGDLAVDVMKSTRPRRSTALVSLDVARKACSKQEDSWVAVGEISK